MDTKTSSDESKSAEPKSTKIESLGNFSLTLTELSLVDKDDLEINGMRHRYISLMARQTGAKRGTVESELTEMAKAALELWTRWDNAIETAQMQDRANNKIQARLTALEQLARWASKLGPCTSKLQTSDGDCLGSECPHCQTRYRAKELV